MSGGAIISEGMRQGLDAPGVNMAHPPGELFCQVVARKMNVEERRLGIAVTGELCNLVKLPPGTGQVRETQMPEGMRGEVREIRLQRQLSHDF